MNVTESGPDLALIRARLLVGGALDAQESGGDTVGSTLMQQLWQALRPLAAGGAWPGRNTSEPAVLPYITFLRIISSSNMTLEGPTDMQGTRVQIDCFSDRYTQAAALADAVSATLLARFVVGSIDAQDFPSDPSTYLFRTSTDYMLWSVD